MRTAVFFSLLIVEKKMNIIFVINMNDMFLYV